MPVSPRWNHERAVSSSDGWHRKQRRRLTSGWLLVSRRSLARRSGYPLRRRADTLASVDAIGAVFPLNGSIATDLGASGAVSTGYGSARRWDRGQRGAAALWALSRTAGAPFGPHAGEPELVQAAGLCALLLEIYVVMGAGWVWYRGRQPEAISAFSNAIVLLGASAVIAAAATAGVASSLLHDDHPAPAGAEHDFRPPISAHQEGHHDHSEPVAPPDSEVTPPSTAPGDVESPTPAVDHGA